MTAIPPFPSFRRLEQTDRAAIEAFTRRFLPYSDVIFTGLWAWDTDESCAISLLGHNLVFRLKDYQRDAHFYTFLGHDEVIETSATLLAHARRTGLLPHLRLVPEEVIAADVRLWHRFSIAEDRDNFDYIYTAEDWARFPTPCFRTHRWKLARCQAQAELEFRLIDPGDPDCQEAMNAVFRRWEAQKPRAAAEACRTEWTALQRLFALSSDHVLAGGCYHGARLVGFSLWEELPDGDYAVGHFQKTDRTYVGLSSRQAQALGQHLVARGCRRINGEQDLGIPGLRAHKLSLRPCDFLRKYVISERGTTKGLTDDLQ